MTRSPSTVVARPSRAAGWLPSAVLGLLVATGIAVRFLLWPVVSGDVRTFLSPWYAHLADGGFAALADEFSNYNTPYLVLLAALTYLPVPALTAIKALSVLVEVLLAGLAYGVARELRPGSAWAPVLVGGGVWLLPTVVLNGAAWAQCDAIYAAGCLGSLLFLLRGRPWMACALFGLAFAFKLQAIFFLPVLVVALVLNRHRLVPLLVVPATFLAALLPALAAGRGLLSQLAIYPAQIAGSSGAPSGGGRGDRLARGGPGAASGSGGGRAWPTPGRKPTASPRTRPPRTRGCPGTRPRPGSTSASGWPRPSPWPSGSGCSPGADR